MNLKELNSFKLSDAVTFHDKLNPKLWNGTKLRPEVREQLMLIAQDFLQELGVHDLDVKDITVSGSNAAYSYTKHSDLDLHILVDMGNLPVDEVYRELFLAKKTIYNDTHDIKIHTIPVELYVQDSRQPVVSLGEYSVMNDQWIRIPTKRRSDFDQTTTKSKYEKLLSLIEIALQSKKYSKVKHIIDTIKRYRQAGLDKGGEFGPENLAYKMLRSQGYITKLYDLRDKLHSEKLSFETMYQNIDEEINPDIYDPNFKHSLKINEFLYKAKTFIEYDEPVLYITAHKGNTPVGHVFFELHQRPGSKPWFESGGTTVESGYEGKGIASTMYAYAKMLGNDVRPSGIQTKQGKNMWTKWKKNGDAHYLMKENPEEFNHWYDSGVKDAQRDAKQYPDRVVKKLNPRTRLKTMQDKRARHPEEVEQYSLGYRGVKQGVAEGQDDNGISFQIQKGKNKFATTLSIGNNSVGVYQYDANTGRSIAEVYPEFKGKGLGKLLVLHAIYTAAKLGLDFQEDESRTSEYDNVLDSLSGSGYIVDDEGYWYVTGEGEQFLKQSLKQVVAEGEINDTAISLSKLSKFHPGPDALAEFVPERASAQYALHPDKWESTFYSLTNKDSDKLRYYGPKKISIPPGTLVGDMAIANKFYRAKTSEEKQQYAEAYKASLQSYPVDVKQYRMPELLIPRQNIDEAFDTPLPITWEKGEHGDVDALAKLPDGTNLSIMFNKQDNIKPDDKTWMVEFYRNNSQEVTGEGDAQKVFSTVLTAIQQFIKKYKPLKIYFSASKEMDPTISYGPDDVVPNPESRAKLYDRMVLRYAKSWGYKFFRADNGSSVIYQLSKMKPNVAEDKENHNSKLDKILYKLCNIVKKEIKEKTGEHAVAACIIDPDNRIVAKTSKDKHGRWIHAEHNAIDTYENKYGEVPEGSIIVTTLSPCNEYDDKTSDERFGESCTDYINSKGIKKVYCGYMDPTQDNDSRQFDIIETSDNDLNQQCKQFADTFLKKNVDEHYTMRFASEKTSAINPYGGLKDNQYRGGISEAIADNYLYHSIESMDTFRKIINTGEIKPKTPIEYEEDDIEMPVISASRNQYYRFPYGGGNIQFVIDKDALKHSGFKVKPYSYAQHYTPTKSTSKNELHKQETEEQIFPFKGHGIPVKQPYIVGIQINPKFKDTPELEEIQKLSKSVNIPVSFMKTATKPAAKKVDIKLTPKFDPNRFVISPATGATKQYFPMMMYDKETKHTYGLDADYTNAQINDRLKNVTEASGYIPSEKQKNDPRYSTALTVDVHPDSIKKNAKAFYWNTSRAGIPPTAKANGKIY